MVSRMPSQKNSGNRGSQRVTPILKKNNSFFDAYMSDVRKDGKVDDVHVGRIIRKLGNGRMEVFYTIGDRGQIVNASIRGLFRGKGKHSVDMDVNSVVIVSDSGIAGPSQFEIVCLLSLDQIRDLQKVVKLDRRILTFEVTDGVELIKDEVNVGGFDFVGGGGELDDDQIDAI